MKIRSTLVLLAGITVVAVYLLLGRTGGRATPSAPAVPQVDPPTAVQSDASEIFQKAFWRRAGEGDTILHAERREWSDVDRLEKWQWYIVVEPSAELVKHLRDDNAFELTPTEANGETKGAPSWFTPPSSDVDVFQAPRGNMRLIFSNTKNLRYASDAGGGFQAGAQEKIKETTAPPASSGRLPSPPPPDPKKGRE
jgi:hypothetical protein